MIDTPALRDPAISVPCHKLGDYHAWALDLGRTAPIDMIWVSKADEAQPLAHLVMPHGEPSIAIRRRRDCRGDFHEIDLVICGPFGKARWYHPQPGEELIAVRLKPEASFASFGIFAGEFLNTDPVAKVTGIENFCGNALRDAEQGEMLDVAQTLLNDLLSCDSETANHETAESATAGMLRKAEGRIPIRAIARHLEISERHLRRRFQGATGMSPKSYARQLRVSATAIRADETPAPDWAMIANDAGYFDQAHMITDFQKLCGQTPVETYNARSALRTANRSVFSNT